MVERKELALVEPENGNLLSIPEQQEASLKNASALAQHVAKIVKDNGLAKKFGSSTKEHVSVEGWLTISRVNNEAPHAKVESIEQRGEYEVIKARAWITDAHGAVVSEADGYCSTEERNWADKPFYARASMAQTRAIGKAMRLRHAWVMVMAGFEATPTEEMDGVQDAPAAAPEKSKPTMKETRKDGKKTYQMPPREGDDAQKVPATVAEDAGGEVVHVLEVNSKSGTKKDGSSWTRYGIKVTFASGETDWLNTFSSTFGAMAEKNKGGQLRAKFDVSEYNGKPQYNLTDLREVNA